MPRSCGGSAQPAHQSSRITAATALASEEATSAIPAANVKLIAADFADLDQVEALWQQALAWRGHIDVFVNNAAVMLWNGGVEESLETWDHVWETDTARSTCSPLPACCARPCSISGSGTAAASSLSRAGRRNAVSPIPATIAYGASKGAIHAATKTIARAYARDGILAYTIAPGVVRTRLSEQFAATAGGEQQITNSLAMGEWVPPAEIADLVAFLATGKARQLSGATLDVNGASYIR